METYCLRCKRMVEIKDPETVAMKNGKPATKGFCPLCGGKIFKMGVK